MENNYEIRNRNRIYCTNPTITYCVRVAQSCPTLFNSMNHLEPIRLLCLWNSPDKHTRVGCYFLLQGTFPTQGLNLGLLHCGQILYHLSHQGRYYYDYILKTYYKALKIHPKMTMITLEKMDWGAVLLFSKMFDEFLIFTHIFFWRKFMTMPRRKRLLRDLLLVDLCPKPDFFGSSKYY